MATKIVVTKAMVAVAQTSYTQQTNFKCKMSSECTRKKKNKVNAYITSVLSNNRCNKCP